MNRVQKRLQRNKQRIVEEQTPGQIEPGAGGPASKVTIRSHQQHKFLLFTPSEVLLTYVLDATYLQASGKGKKETKRKGKGTRVGAKPMQHPTDLLCISREVVPAHTHTSFLTHTSTHPPVQEHEDDEEEDRERTVSKGHLGQTK